MNEPTPFNRALALGFIGAGANGTPMVNTDGRKSDHARDATPQPAGDDGFAASNGMLLRNADVRSVRREDRPHPITKEVRRLVVADWVASTESIDFYESILIADWDKNGGLDQFRKNPVLLWAHDRSFTHSMLAIGHCENVRVEKNQLLLTCVFDDTTEFDREIAEKVEKGVIRMGSVGFDWTKAELRTVGDREVVVFSGNSLREFSICNIGANNDALSQRDLVRVTRELVRARGSIAQQDAITAYREQHTRAAKTSPTPAIPTPRAPQPGAPKDITMKTLPIDVRAHRASPTTPVACPACNEAMAVQLTNVPEADEKAVADLTARATAAEGKLSETTRSLDVTKTELDAAKARIAAMEPELTAARATAEKHQAERVAAAIDERVGKRIFATERATEIKLAGLLLADRTPDPDKAGSTLGEKAWSARLAEIDARPDIGLLGAPITGADQKNNTGAGHEPQARSLAAEIDALLAKQAGAALPS
jgi:phage head maturation protease